VGVGFPVASQSVSRETVSDDEAWLLTQGSNSVAAGRGAMPYSDEFETTVAARDQGSSTV
jgi:hypothetical protein